MTKIYLVAFFALVAIFGSIMLVRHLYPIHDYQLLAPVKPPVPAEVTKELKVVIGGDVMLDRQNRALGETYSYDYLFQGVASLFKSADIGVVNLEGPVTDYPSKTLLSNGETDDDLTFTFATNTPEALAAAGISLIGLANNHTYNFGAEGLAQTHEWLSKAGVEWFGDPLNTEGTEQIVCKNSICVAFVGYHEFNPGKERILADVKRLSGEGYPVIVMAHWGDEYATNTPSRVKAEAREFVDAGATAIVGAHPHVIGDKEWVGNVPVIYSLGNLLFDQYFSQDVMTGNVAELDFEKNGDDVYLDKVFLYTVSNASRQGPVVVGLPIEFSE